MKRTTTALSTLSATSSSLSLSLSLFLSYLCLLIPLCFFAWNSMHLLFADLQNLCTYHQLSLSLPLLLERVQNLLVLCEGFLLHFDFTFRTMMERLAMEQNFYEPETRFVSVGDVSVKKWNSISSPTTVSDNDTGSFDCNICLDSAHEPVVTLCGHLYCWPCIYKWLQVPSTSDEQSNMPQTCPVCKANISPSSVVPLYGRGISSSDSDGKKPQLDMVVPRRPPPMSNTLITATTATSTPRQQLHPDFLQRHSQSVHDQYHPAYGGYATNSESAYLGGTTMTNLSNPTIGMVGEFVFARMFGSSNTSLFTYPYLNSYTPSSPRMRRQEVELDKSLNRVTFFLFCCFMLCLLLF